MKKLLAFWAKRPKLTTWGMLGAALLGGFFALVPVVATAVLYKYAVLIFGTVLLYWLNRNLGSDARPSQFLDENLDVLPGKQQAYAAALQHRALIIGCGLIALALLV